MASIERFEDIEAWKAARGLAAEIYKLSREPSLSRDFGLVDQMRRAAVSVMANIAEGFDSRSPQEFLRFLGYAYRSTSELQSHLYVILDQGWLDEASFDALYLKTCQVQKLLNGFIRYLRKRRNRGEP